MEWSKSVTASWSGITSHGVIIFDEVINLNVDHDLEILRKYAWKGNNALKHRVYIDKEERATTINYLNKCYIAKKKKKNLLHRW